MSDPPAKPTAAERFARFAWQVFVANLAVILWGTFVRASGSGAGCGSHWPLCNGEVLPRAENAATLIEFTHRLTSGLVLILVVVLMVRAFRVFERGHAVRRWAVWTMIFMVGEAAIGAGLVLFELVAENESMARAMFMATHLVNTFLLLGALALTAHVAGGQASPTWRNGPPRLKRLIAGSILGTLLLGASGAVAALGDTLHPSSSLREALAQDLAPTSHLLIQLRILHPLIAVVMALVLLKLISAVRRTPRPLARRYANYLNLLVILQVVLGSVSIILLAPVWLQLSHLLLADLVWLALVLTAASVLIDEPEPSPRALPTPSQTPLQSGD